MDGRDGKDLLNDLDRELDNHIKNTLKKLTQTAGDLFGNPLTQDRSIITEPIALFGVFCSKLFSI